MSGEELRAAAQHADKATCASWVTPSMRCTRGRDHAGDHESVGAWTALGMAALAAPSTPEPSGLQVASVSELREWLGLAGAEATDETATRLQRLLRAHRVASHATHDQDGEPNEGFPVCSVCGAIQTGAAPSIEPALDVKRLARAMFLYRASSNVPLPEDHWERQSPSMREPFIAEATAILARLAESQP